MEIKGGKYQCPFCDYKIGVKSSIDSHIRFHTQEKHFICDQCKRGFVTKFYLNLHVKRVHEGKKHELDKFKCSLCPYATFAKRMLEAHTQACHEDRSFPCTHPPCQYAGKSEKALWKHNKNMHSLKMKRKAFVCKFSNCGYRAATRQILRHHSVTHSEERPFVCDFEGCSYRAKLWPALRTHKLGVHNGGHKPFACSICDHCTTTKALLRKHEQLHSLKKSIKCSFSGCEYSCKLKGNLDHHVLRRHADKPFKCDFTGCSATAGSRSLLEEHKRKVHCSAKFKCPNCNYRAKERHKLKRHIATHKASRGISCPHKGCHFQTKHRDHFNQHVKCHEANLGCPVKGCGYVGQSSSSLKNHMRLHDSKERPVLCPLCPKYFASNNNLSKHLPSHTQEKPFQCPECNFAAAQQVNIRKHKCKTQQNRPTRFYDEFICDHCVVNFASAIHLAMHTIKLKTAVVVLTRLQLKFEN